VRLDRHEEAPVKSRFRIYARLDDASRAQHGTVTIDRENGLVTIRPLRRRRVYEFLLGDLASMAVRAQLRAEASAKRAAKKHSRRLRSAS
jgi:hypothetical protein